MARKLPWLSGNTKVSTDGTATSTASRTTKRRKVRPAQSDSEDNASDASSTSPPTSRAIRQTARTARNPSSSPPPPPPRQDFMRAGLEQDDIWVMVEDEFLSTAHLYTSHLHKAEYLRLKKLARSQNASTIQNISRPVDDRTEQSGESRKKMEGARLRAMGTKAMQNLEGDRRGLGRGEDGDEDEDNDPWMRDPRLAGLMTQRENNSQLSRITGAKSKTRASAGYAQASQSQGVTREIQEDVDNQEIKPRRTLPKPQSRPAARVVEEEKAVQEKEEENSDDLGGPSQSYSKYSKPHPPLIPARKAELPQAHSRAKYTFTTTKTLNSTGKRVDSFPSLKSDSSEDVRSKPSTIPITTIRNANSDLSMHLDDFDGFPKRQALSSRAIGRFGKKKEETKAAERKKRSEEVPTFLF
ncbi:hypothetical protein BLS_001141 [Venturia inaequalis]|uniref:Uncharacterized protein n=1 Tax=Venturia inaequalis TaxID=5025 RepID=A0A8H3ZB58_VENIN|nr:hypothetical protein BLS_001141 [Venturia inaequalis]KAE9982389.1 hypothetical protein EG328_010923 [Venturia inaequalis]KAE9989828.1 hypothetical protein EG327_002216 [Venturia inaequalis]